MPREFPDKPDNTPITYLFTSAHKKTILDVLQKVARDIGDKATHSAELNANIYHILDFVGNLDEEPLEDYARYTDEELSMKDIIE
jgi:hypothetical protein